MLVLNKIANATRMKPQPALTIIKVFVILICAKPIYGHEETYKSFELSNLHLKVIVGCEDSYQLHFAKLYAPVINEFITEIDSTQKVFIQFNEDYCAFNYDLALVSIDSFMNTIVPKGFSNSRYYDSGFIKYNAGLNIIISQKSFKLEPLLKLIEFSLKNRKYILQNQKPFKLDSIIIHPVLNAIVERDFTVNFKSLSSEVIDSITSNIASTRINECMNNPISLNEVSEEYSDYKLLFYLKNDSVLAKDDFGCQILKIPTLLTIFAEKESKSLFLINSDSSFYYFNNGYYSTDEEYFLSFNMRQMCKLYCFIKYFQETNCYLLGSGLFVETRPNQKRDYFHPEVGIVNSCFIQKKSAEL